MSKDNLPEPLGYYKPNKDTRGYLKVSLPVEYCRKANISENTDLYAIYDPKDRSITFKPQKKPKRGMY